MGSREWLYGQPGFTIYEDDPSHVLAETVLAGAGFADKPRAFNEAVHGFGIFIEWDPGRVLSVMDGATVAAPLSERLAALGLR
jgi:hypothetical protein